MAELTREDMSRLRITAERVYETVDGRAFVDALLEDLGLYEEPENGNEAVLHAFAIGFMQKYFGVFMESAEHRSEMTKALMSTAIVSTEE